MVSVVFPMLHVFQWMSIQCRRNCWTGNCTARALGRAKTAVLRKNFWKGSLLCTFRWLYKTKKFANKNEPSVTQRKNVVFFFLTHIERSAIFTYPYRLFDWFDWLCDKLSCAVISVLFDVLFSFVTFGVELYVESTFLICFFSSIVTKIGFYIVTQRDVAVWNKK